MAIADHAAPRFDRHHVRVGLAGQVAFPVGVTAQVSVPRSVHMSSFALAFYGGGRRGLASLANQRVHRGGLLAVAQVRGTSISRATPMALKPRAASLSGFAFYNDRRPHQAAGPTVCRWRSGARRSSAPGAVDMMDNALRVAHMPTAATADAASLLRDRKESGAVALPTKNLPHTVPLRGSSSVRSTSIRGRRPKVLKCTKSGHPPDGGGDRGSTVIGLISL